MKLNKRKVYIIFALLAVVAVLLVLVYEYYINLYKYDNDVSISQIKNQQFTEREIKDLEEDIFAGDITVKRFIRKYRPLCIRKTYQGYYAVLIQNNNRMCFIFWDNKDNIYNIYKTGGFLSHDAVKNDIEIGKTNLQDITDGGSDFCYYPISKMVLTGHICSDGVLIVKYDSNLIAESIEFFSNEELESSNDYLLQLTPYILPKDK